LGLDKTVPTATKPKRVIFFPENTEPILSHGRLAGHFSTGGGAANCCDGMGANNDSHVDSQGNGRPQHLRTN